MGLELGNLLGAVAQATTAAASPKSLKSFLDTINHYGVQVANNFEVNFSGLQDIIMYVTSISIPGMQLKTTEVAYDGQKVEVPVNYDWDHDFNITIINDAQGYIYPAVTNFFMANASSSLVNSGYTLTIKALTGDDQYKGTLYTLYGVRITSVGNLQYAFDSNEKSTFEVSLKCTHFTATPGALGTAAGIIGAVNSLVS